MSGTFRSIQKVLNEATCRAQADHARQLAARSEKEDDRTFWLRLADDWMQLAQEAERKRLSISSLIHMKNDALLQRLAQAEEHILQGERHIRRQRRIIAEFRVRSRDATLVNELLDGFNETQAMHIAERDRLQRELAEWLRAFGADDSGVYPE
jgi:hypothetical protein